MTHIFRPLIILAVLLSVASSAIAQNYPTKPVRLIIPYAGGGSADYTGRLVAQKLSQALGQQVLPDNRPGANGNIGTELAAKAEADGYTLLLASEIQFVINPAVYPNLRQDLIKSFEPVTLIGVSYNVLVANPNIPAHDVREFIAYAKANPGKINYASPGTASPNHLSMELLSHLTGAKMVHVPYKGTGQAMPDVISGQVQAMLTAVPATLPYLNGGKLRILGVGGPKRLAAMPDVPTIAEGGFPGFESSVAWSLFAPAGTPRVILNRLHEEAVKFLNESDLQERFDKAGLTPMSATGAEVSARLQEDLNKWPRVIREAGIKLQH